MKFLKRNHQKININERFTGIMKAKGHVSPFARGTKPDQQGKNWMSHSTHVISLSPLALKAG